jgi:parvulin-like peptidyl-prolyl isomerase
MDGGTRRRALGAAGLAALGLAGCVGGPYSCAAKEAARPDAAKVLADAPALLPEQPVTSTTATRGQAPDPAAAGGVTQVAARIRASVNGVPILEEELREATAQYAGELLAVPEAQRAEVLKKVADRELQRLIERELVLEEALTKLRSANQTQTIQKLQEMAAKEADKRIRDIKASLKVDSDEELKAILQNQGLSVAGIRRQVERNAMMMEYVRNVIFPVVERISLQQVRDYYEKHSAEFQVQDRVRWQDIFIDASRFPDPAAARRYAEQVWALARSGQDFAKLAEQYDHGDSRLRNGDGLGTKRGEVRPAEAEPVVWALKPGEVGPLIDLGFGFHIVKVAERDYAGRRPFDVDCQTEVRKKLQSQIADREYKRLVDDLKKRAAITVY